jgi:NAD(P)H-hydrate epimerase
MRISVAQAASLTLVKSPDLVIDGVIGYRLNGAPSGPAADLIRWANAQDAPILSLDVPSGVDTTTGTIYDPAICAMATMTLALPKKGFLAMGVDRRVGELYLADIGVPPVVFENLGLSVHVGNLFSESEVIRLCSFSFSHISGRIL